VATDLGGNVVHYRMLGTTRVYAMEKLVLNGEAGAMARRHAIGICSRSVIGVR
jgi:predicted ATPase